MKKILFITSNAGKVQEVQHILEPLGFQIEQKNFDLTEIQASQEKVVAQKALEARKFVSEALVVEDTGFYIDCFRDFPGIYARHVVKAIGLQGILKLVEGTDRKAHFLSIVAFLPENSNEPLLFEGESHGKIAQTETNVIHKRLMYDSIFIPNGETKTYGELGLAAKAKYSHRTKAFQALASYLAKVEEGESK